jgi:hypothetical protein
MAFTRVILKYGIGVAIKRASKVNSYCQEKNLDKPDEPMLGSAPYILRSEVLNAGMRQR